MVQIGAYPESPDLIKGGVEASVYGLSQQQSQTMEVHVFDVPRIGGPSRVERDGEVTVHRFGNEGKRQVMSASRVEAMAKEIVELKPDVCHIHGTNLFSWLMYRKLRRKHQLTAVTVHGLARVEKRNLLQKRFTLKRLLQYLLQGTVEKSFLSNLPEVIVDTEYVKERIAQYPIRKKPGMRVIPQGINESFFKIECSPESRMFLSVGAIGGRKGHLLTLQAFEQLRRKGIDAELTIAGVVADPAYHRQLLEMARRSEYKDSIRVVTDLPAKELHELYRMAHVFVLHSEEESQGIVFAEALATGMPVVATEVGGVPYVVGNGMNGLLSPYGDVAAFSANMERIMSDEVLWQAMSEAAKSASRHYDWLRISEEVNNFYGV